MCYSFKTNHKTVTIEDAIEITAAFLYEQQKGNKPNWITFPGDYETRDFYSINDSEGKFLAVDTEGKVFLLDTLKQAESFADVLGILNNKKYYVHLGRISKNSFIVDCIDTVDK